MVATRTCTVLQKSLFCQLFLCLSRSCLVKMIIFSIVQKRRPRRFPHRICSVPVWYAFVCGLIAMTCACRPARSPKSLRIAREKNTRFCFRFSFLVFVSDCPEPVLANGLGAPQKETQKCVFSPAILWDENVISRPLILLRKTPPVFLSDLFTFVPSLSWEMIVSCHQKTTKAQTKRNEKWWWRGFLPAPSSPTLVAPRHPQPSRRS